MPSLSGEAGVATDYDVIVIGAGHAGCEAAYAAARLGCRVAVCTLTMDTVAHMPCNPAIGGTAKGHLVREIDALGGLMGRAIDATGIQFKLLNRSRGPAVWSPRAQADKRRYSRWVAETLASQDGITFVVAKVGGLLVESGRVHGVELEEGGALRAGAVVVTTGTFLNGLIHVGPSSFAAGRVGEEASNALGASIRRLDLRWGRLKTGTPPRLDRRSIDFRQFEEQRGDDPPVPFSFSTTEISRPQYPCHVLHTTSAVHELVRQSIHLSPLYNGRIQGIGPRYCPSLEDKVMRFPEKEGHQIFLEPEGVDVDEIYVNGYSMSLPAEVQERLVRALPGLEEAVMLRPGYAVEYDFVQPTELELTLEVGKLRGLFLAGQVNGTSGYEEAAAQGLIAGVNAAKRVLGGEPVVVRRHDGYIGILIDDLTTRGCLEPYRMFTSRAEFRLLLRIDNADLRLTEMGRRAGLVPDDQWGLFESRRTRFEANRARLATTTVVLESGIRMKATEALRQPPVTLAALVANNDLNLDASDRCGGLDLHSLETEIKYEGYLKRQASEVERSRRNEEFLIPAEFSYPGVPGLSAEMVQRLGEVRPANLGQAARIPGVTPAAVAVLASRIRSRRGIES